MASAFNLTAQINLRGPTNIGNIVSNIRKQLGTINANVNFRIDPNATRNVTQLNAGLRNLNITLAQTQTAARNAATAISALSNAVGSLGNTANLSRNISNAATATQRIGQNANTASRQLNAARTEMEEFGRQSALAIRRFAAFNLVSNTVFSLVNNVKSGVAAFIEFDKQFVKLQQVTGESAKGLQGLAKTITSLSTNFGVASQDLTNVASTLAQAGLSARDTERALKALALSALAPSFDDMNKTVEGSIALMRQFGISAKDLESSLGSINAVAAKFAVEAGDIIAAIQRTGGVFANASKGVSEGTDALNEFVAVFTSVRATTRESAETIATGLRTIFTRIQRAGTVEALKEFGVTLTDAEGKFVGAYKAVQLLSEGLNRIDPRDLKFSQIVEELGGFRQIGKVIPLIQQFATAQDALKVAQQGQGSLAADAVKAQLSLANQVSKVREEFLALFREIGSSDSFQTLARGALDMASALIKVADSVKGVLPVLGIMLAFKGLGAATQFGAGFVGGLRRSGGARGAGSRLAGAPIATGGVVRHYKTGGRVDVPVALMPGESVVGPEIVQQVGLSRLRKINHADKKIGRRKFAKGGIAQVPGTGRTDSFYTTLPEGSFVVRTDATKALGGPKGVLEAAYGKRQKFASGGTVAQLSTLSPGIGRSRISAYIDDNKDIRKRRSTIQSKDMVFSNILRKIITKNDIGDRKKFKSNINQRTALLQKNQGGQQYSVQGLAFENWIWDNIPDIKQKYRKAPTKTYPIDLIPKTDAIIPAEIKFTGEQVADPFILNKRLRYNLLNKNTKRFTKNIDREPPVNLGETIVYELAPGLKDWIFYGDRKIPSSTKRKRLQRQQETQEVLKNSGFIGGGYIQKLMAGDLAKKSKKVSQSNSITPASLVTGPYPATDKDGMTAWSKVLTDNAVATGLTYDSVRRTFRINNQNYSYKDILSPRQLDSSTLERSIGKENITKLKALRGKIVQEFSGKKIGVQNLTKSNTPAEIAAARGQNLLFAAAGMFGRRFAPRNMMLSAKNTGLKQDTNVSVFGSVLDKDRIEKEAKLKVRKQRIENINRKRSAQGKTALEDTGSIFRAAAPTASELSKSFQRSAAATVAKQNKKLALDTVSAVANEISPSTRGRQIFLDFDKTLAIGADKIGPKINKKSPDYAAFGDPKQISQGLGSAKLTSLGVRLKKLIANLDSKQAGLGQQLLQRMFVVSARPQKTMPLIARWIRSQGLRIPPGNVSGVGGPSVAPSGVGLAKAEKMLALGAGPGSIFIDDEGQNIEAARSKGISSIRYGFKFDKSDPIARKQAATEEGYQFEKFINDNLPPALKRAFFSPEGEGIDFPTGLDPQTAKYWFNDPRLVGVPVDTKRTVSGASVIKDNVVSYLKTKGYASGGFIQKFGIGDQVESYYGEKEVLAARKQWKKLKRTTRGIFEPTVRPGRRGSGISLGIPTVKSMSANTPQSIVDEVAQSGRLVYGTGIGELAKGAPGIVSSKQLQLAAQQAKTGRTGQQKARKVDSRTLKSFAKAGIETENVEAAETMIQSMKPAEIQKLFEQSVKRAPAGRYLTKTKEYESDPEFRKMMGLDSGVKGGAVKQFEALAKENVKKGIFERATYLDKIPDALGQIKAFRADLNKKLAQTTDREIQKSLQQSISKANTAVAVIEEGKGIPKLPGQVTALSWAVRQAIPNAKQLAKGGEVPMMTHSARTGDKTNFIRSKVAARALGGPISFGGGGTPRANMANTPGFDVVTSAFQKKRRLSGAEMQKAAKIKGYDIERLDNGKIVLSMRGKTMYTLDDDQASELLSSMVRGNMADGTTRKFVRGGEVPIMAQEGEYIINRHSARAIGYGNLARLNKYHTGGKVQKFAAGGAIDTALSGMSPRDAAKIKASIQKNVAAFDQLEKMWGTLPIKDFGFALKNFTRALEKGISLKDALKVKNIPASGSGPGGIDPDTVTPSKRQKPKVTGAGGASDPRRAGSVGAPGTFTSVVGFQGQQLSGRLTNTGQIQQSYIAKASKQAAQQIEQMGYTSDISKKAILTFNTTLKKTANAQIAMEAATKAAASAYKNVPNALFTKPNKPTTSGSSGLFGRIGNFFGFGGGAGVPPGGAGSPPTGGMPPSGPGGGGLGSGSSSMRQRARQLRSQGLRGQALRDQMGAGGMMSKLQNAGIGLGFAVPMIAEQFTVAEPKNERQARQNAMASGIGTAVGSASMLASMGRLGMAAAVPVAIGGIIKAFADAENAMNDFAKKTQSDKLQESLEKASSALDKYSANVKDVANEEKARKAVLQAVSDAEKLSEKNKTPTASMVGNIAKMTGFMPQDNMEFQRSQILEQKGLMSYLGTLDLGTTGQFFGVGSGGANTADVVSIGFKSLIPQFAKENAKSFQGASEASSRFLEEQFKSGKTVEDLTATGDLDKFGKSLALADIKVQEQLMAIDNSTNLIQSQKDAMKQNIIATQTESKAREIQTRALRQKALDDLNRKTTQLQNSLERMFQNLEQSINANAYALSKLTDSAELSAAALSGGAKAGNVRLDSINVLQNPRAYSRQQQTNAITQGASAFGSQASMMEGVLQLSGKLEDSLMRTINNTIKAANASGQPVTQEAIGAKLETNINQVLSDLKIPPEIGVGLSRQIRDAIEKIRTKEDDKLDFSEIINQVPQLGKVLESSRRAQELAIKSLEHWQQTLNEYANSMNQIVDLQIDSNSKLRRSNDILIRGNLELNKALGRSVSLDTSKNVALMNVRSQTGGLTDPAAIANRIQNLDLIRQNQEAGAQGAAQQGFGGKDQFIFMQQNLKNTNVALRENYDALKTLADSSEIASAAMEKISQIRQKQQAGVGIAERLVTSSPEELANLNRSMMMLNNNMRGGLNVGSTAEDRRATLEVFNMIAPLLGDRQDSLKANVLEGMLRESGLGVNPMMQQVLDGLRNPASDPEMAKAIAIYQEGNRLQSEANLQLVRLNSIIEANTADVAAQKLVQAMQGVTFSFEQQTLNDINAGIQSMVGILKNNPGAAQPQTIASGGLVYAAAGQYINFQPKGTDTVPAMLTPGEFVVNKTATQRNLPLLQQINNGYQNGGKVNYYATGGYVFSNNFGKKPPAETMESEKALTGFNWPILMKEPIKYNTKLGAAYDLPFFAGKNTPSPLVTSQKLDENLGIHTLSGLGWFPGKYYNGYTLVHRGGSDFDRNNIWSLENEKIDYSMGKINKLSIPDSNWIDKINKPYAKKIPQSQQTGLINQLRDILSKIPTISRSGDTVSIDSMNLKTGKPVYDNAANPSYNISYNKNGTKERFDIKFQDLSARLSSGFLLNNIDGFGRGYTPPDSGEPVIASINLAGLFKEKQLNISTGSAPNVGGRGLPSDAVFSIFKGGGSAFQPLDISKFGGDTVVSELDNIIRLRETLNEALATAQNSKFTESSASLDYKKTQNKLKNLVTKATFRESFSPDEINYDKVTTLYNIDKIKWRSLAKGFSSNAGTYAKDSANFIPIDIETVYGNFAPAGEFPWITEGFNDTDILEQQRTLTRFGDLVKTTPDTYTDLSKGIKFSYKKIEGPLWDRNTNSFTNKKDYKFNIIDKDGLTGAMSPLSGLQLNNDTQAVLIGRDNPDMQTYINNLLSTLSTGKIYPKIVSRLSSNDAFLSPDYSALTKSNAFRYDSIFGGGNPMEFEPLEYKKALDKLAEDKKKAARDKAIGLTAKAAVATDFTESKQVALARFVINAARKNIKNSKTGKGYGNLNIPFRKLETPQDIEGIVNMMGQMIPYTRNPELQALAYGYQAVLQKISTGDSQYFRNLGFDITNGFQDPLKKKIRNIRTGLFEDQTYSYGRVNLSEEFIKALAWREGTAAKFQVLMKDAGQALDPRTGKMVGVQPGALTTTEQKQLTVKGGKFAEVAPDGTIKYTEMKDSDTVPKNFSDLVRIGLNPYNEFTDNRVRYNILEKIQQITNSAVYPGTKKKLFDKNIMEYMNIGLDTLQTWYRDIQDQLLNTSNTQDQYKDFQNRLPTKETFVRASREQAQPYNAFFTANSQGELPTYEWLSQSLAKRAETPQTKATDGLIYASAGRLINFQPKGTDTVPAMLTPGEFVVNRQATQKNLPLLQSINKNKGGKVTYLATGGIANTGTPIAPVSSSDIATQNISDNLSAVLGITSQNLDATLGVSSQTKNIAKTTSGIANNTKNLKVLGFSSGGMVYASTGALVPGARGTDITPAMLTPGEFVVNKSATAANLPLLQAMNSGYYQDGGKVFDNRKFISSDGKFAAIGSLTDVTKTYAEILKQNGKKVKVDLNKLSNFDKQYALDNLPYFKEQRFQQRVKAFKSLGQNKGSGYIEINSPEKYLFTDPADEWAIAGQLMSADDLSLKIKRSSKEKAGQIIDIPKSILSTQSSTFANKLIKSSKAKRDAQLAEDMGRLDSMMGNLGREDDVIVPDTSVSPEEIAKNNKMTQDILSQYSTNFKDIISIGPDFEAIIDPITRKPKTVQGKDINLPLLYKTLDDANYQARMPATDSSAQLGETIQNLKSWIMITETAKMTFDQNRKFKNSQTQKRYEELLAKDKAKKLAANESLEFAMLSIERGAKPINVADGLQAERILRDEAFGKETRQRIEKSELEKFKKKLSEEKRESMFGKVSKELASYTGPFAPITEFLLSFLGPDAIAMEIGGGPLFQGFGKMFSAFSRTGAGKYITKKALSNMDAFSNSSTGQSIIKYAQSFKDQAIELAQGAKITAKTIASKAYNGIKTAMEVGERLLGGDAPPIPLARYLLHSGRKIRVPDDIAKGMEKQWFEGLLRQHQKAVKAQRDRAVQEASERAAQDAADNARVQKIMEELDLTDDVASSTATQTPKTPSPATPQSPAQTTTAAQDAAKKILDEKRAMDAASRKPASSRASAQQGNAAQPANSLAKQMEIERRSLITKLSDKEQSIYDIFDLPEGAPFNISDIIQKYRKMQKLLHPDVAKGVDPRLSAKVSTMVSYTKTPPGARFKAMYDKLLKDGIDSDTIIEAFNPTTEKFSTRIIKNKYPQYDPSKYRTGTTPPPVGPTAATGATAQKVSPEEIITVQQLLKKYYGDIPATATPDYKALIAGNLFDSVNTLKRSKAWGSVSPEMQQKLNEKLGQILKEQKFATFIPSKINEFPSSWLQLVDEKGIGTSITGKNIRLQDLELISPGLRSITNNSLIRSATYKLKSAAKATPKSTGGVVYASTGKLIDFQPRGTDTVPAMLTPGEFVINRQATQKHLPLLQAINNGYASGGKVNYLAGGGLPAPPQPAQQPAQKPGEFTGEDFDNTYKALNKEDRIKKWPTLVKALVAKLRLSEPYLDVYNPNSIKENLRIAQIQQDILNKQGDYTDSAAAYARDQQRYSLLRDFASRSNQAFEFYKKNKNKYVTKYDMYGNEPQDKQKRMLDVLAIQSVRTYSDPNQDEVKTLTTPDGTKYRAGPDGSEAYVLYQAWKNAFNQKPDILGMKAGGLVYASKGTLVPYKPRGTDTIPAMLTPGEFVVNRDATRQNLSLLQAINNNQNIPGFSSGGIAYLSGGGLPKPSGAAGGAVIDITKVLGGLIGQLTSSISQSIATALEKINKPSGSTNGVSNINYDALQKFSQNLANIANTLAGLDAIPSEIKITGRHDLNVIINGDSALNRLSIDLQNLVISNINAAFKQFVDNNPSLQNSVYIPQLPPGR